MSTPEQLSRPLADRVATLPDVVDRNDNPPTPEAVQTAAIQALADGKTHYTDRPGILPLRTWVVDQLNAHGLTLSPDAVTITCGITEARFVTIRVLAAAGSHVYCPGDSMSIIGAVQLAEANLAQSADGQSISVAYVTSQDSDEAIETAASLMKANNGWLIWEQMSDEISQHPAAIYLDLADRIVSIGGFESQLPGWRIGWMAGSEKAGKLRAYKQSMTICSPSISQWAALGLVENA